MKLIKLLCISAFLTFAAASVHAQDGAYVLNHSDGLGCTIFGFGLNGLYAGPATLVETPSGKVNAQCNAVLVDGDPEEDATRISNVIFGSPVGSIECDIQVTPSGHANLIGCDEV